MTPKPAAAGRIAMLASLHTVGARIASALLDWTQHTTIVVDKNGYTRRELQADARPSTSSRTLQLLEDIVSINKRLQKLREHKHGMSDLTFTGVAALVARPYHGTETKTWHAKFCLARMEQVMERIRERIEEQEAALLEVLRSILSSYDQLLEMEETVEIQTMAAIVSLVEVGEQACETALDGGVLTEELREGVEVAMESLRQSRRNWCGKLGEQDRLIYTLMKLASDVGIRAPRQRLITEYFKPRRS